VEADARPPVRRHRPPGAPHVDWLGCRTPLKLWPFRPGWSGAAATHLGKLSCHLLFLCRRLQLTAALLLCSPRRSPSIALVFVFRAAPVKPPSTSSTVRHHHRCFIRHPDRLTPSHLPPRSLAVEPSLSPSPAATMSPPA
jgi:hypothetical protein